MEDELRRIRRIMHGIEYSMDPALIRESAFGVS
jgi:hypothetical protein